MSHTCQLRLPAVALALALATAAGVCAAEPGAVGSPPADPELCPEARRVLAFIRKAPAERTPAGIPAGISSWGGGPNRVLAATGREPALYTVDARVAVAGEGPVGEDAGVQRLVDECLWWWRDRGGILTMQFHWPEPGRAKGGPKRSGEFDVGRAVTPGTPEHALVAADLRRVADLLDLLQQARVPVLWRPLHEIDGGWFWWTDGEKPENTAALWRLMFDYFVHERKLHNLVWVYSAAHVETGIDREASFEDKMAHRRRFYAGDDWVDLAGIDIYVGLGNFRAYSQRWASDAMRVVVPGKPLALCECGALPNPDLMRKDAVPFTYCLAWFALDQRNPVPWLRQTFNHDYILTLDELPPLHDANAGPNVRIDEPAAGATTPGRRVVLRGTAGDRDGRVAAVELYRLGGEWLSWAERPESAYWKGVRPETLVGRASVADDGRWKMEWQDVPGGCHDLVAVATDDDGARAHSNVLRLAAGVQNLARGRAVTASSAAGAAGAAVDGDLYTMWSGIKKEPQALTVDLGAVQQVNGVATVWWKARARAFRVRTSTDGTAWHDVCAVTESHRNLGDADVAWFDPQEARYVQLLAQERGTQWGGFSVFEFLVFGPETQAAR
jgi:hypothetical protein